MSNPVERIKDAVDVKKLLGFYNAQHISGSGNVRSCCPIHQGDNKTAFVFHENEKVFYCHTGSCGGGDIFDFVMAMDECSFIVAVKKLAELFSITVDWENETIEENLFRDQAKSFIERMMRKKNVHELPAFKLPPMKMAKVQSYRGYSQETIEWWKLRMCTEGELKDRLVIPFEDVDKRLVGITGRATKAEQKEKFLHRPRNLHTGFFLTGLGRNLEYVKEAGGAVKICEGVFDCCRWFEAGYKNTCAPIGVFFTDEHILQLYKAGVTILEFGFDGDKAGRNGFRKAYKKAKGKFEIYFLDYGAGKDADDSTTEELQKVHENRMTWFEFIEKYGEKLEK